MIMIILDANSVILILSFTSYFLDLQFSEQQRNNQNNSKKYDVINTIDD
jgi:hypothetical protein